MSLFLTIMILCCSVTFSSDIIKLVQLSKILSPSYKKNISELQEKLRKAQADLDNFKAAGPSQCGEYAYFIKTKRFEDKVNDCNAQIMRARCMGEVQSASMQLVQKYGIKALLYLALIVISIRNRYNPVIVFDQTFNLFPLQGLLSFPTGVPQAVSVPIWVLSCNVTFKLISGLIKRKI